MNHEDSPVGGDASSLAEQVNQESSFATENLIINSEREYQLESLQHEIADIALGETVIKADKSEEVDLIAGLDSVLAEISLDSLNQAAPEAISKIAELRYIMEDAQHMLAKANYEGADFARQLAPQINDLLSQARQKSTKLEEIATTVRTDVRKVEEEVDESTYDIRKATLDQPSDEVRFKLRRLEEAISELGSASRLLTNSHDEISTLMSRHGMIERALYELQYESWGHETAIAQIRHGLQQVEDSLNMFYRGAAYLESAVSEVDRIRK